MSAFFVTAIGTEIGKTYVSAALLRAWTGQGHGVHALKPVMSGFGEDELAASDAGQLLAACGQAVTPETVSRICLHRFEAPLAPNVAMRQAGVAQDYDGILAFTRERLAQAGADRMIVEGAGGVMSPLTDTALQLDFMVDLGLPVILVAAPYLGAVSHTLSAIDALQARGLDLAQLIISQPDPESPSPASLGGEVSLFREVAWCGLGHGEAFNAGRLPG
ncbi:dethiobiotin synthase [Henriciella aquimarina]|uniref:dethiobiotin synthase n=1 Tax=Henriciella aquimarina TaxID=545261 RepID=UPI0009FCE950|nr:dethiobiotin synthase [Henriciella aquimarina]